MKKKSLAIVSLSLAFWSVQALASDTRPDLRPRALFSADLIRFNIDRKIPWADEVTSGRITVDRAGRKLNLNLDRRFHCPPGRYCAMVMPAGITLEAPLVSVERDTCGSVHYKAVDDRRSRQGGMTVITLSDNTANRCPTFAALADTEVVYETESASYGTRPVHTRSTFQGARLQRVQ